MYHSNFNKRSDAEKFALLWTRFSCKGHIICSGNTNVDVILHDVNKKDID